MDWFSLTLILSCIASALVLSMRAITPETNPFLFMGFVTFLASCVLVIYCLAAHISLALESRILKIAVMAGCSVAAIDLAFIFMFRKGATVSVTMQIFRISSILLSALIGLILFHEGITPVKLGGIVLACMAVYLLNSKKKEEVIL